MESSRGGGAPLDDETIQRMAADLLVQVMRSASTDDIRPIDWWPRARSAMETAASVARSYGQLVAKMARKLQIEAYREASSRSISEIGAELDAAGPGAFARFRRVAKRDAAFIVAMAQIQNDERRAERQAHQATKGKPADLESLLRGSGR